MGDAETLARGAVEALLDDEALRGDLSDEGFGPLLDWGVGTLTALARELARAPDGATARARLAAAGKAVKGVIAAAVTAAQGGTPEDLRALLREAPLARDPAARARVAAIGLRLSDDADINAARLARALRGLRP